jgi:hypothetical protein
MALGDRIGWILARLLLVAVVAFALTGLWLAMGAAGTHVTHSEAVQAGDCR